MNIKEYSRMYYTGCTNQCFVAMALTVSYWGGLCVSNHVQIVPAAKAPIMPPTSELCLNKQMFEESILRSGFTLPVIPQLGMFSAV